MLEFLTVPAGSYRIGTSEHEIDELMRKLIVSRSLSPDLATEIRSWIEKELPAHQVTTKEFSMSRTPVRNSDIREYLNETGAEAPESFSGPEDHPCWGVSIEWAKDFAGWLSTKTGTVYRLPTETEWEVAARGPEGLLYPYGKEFDPSKANTNEGKIGRPTSVEAYAAFPGPFGHVDLAGNVEEWVSTPYYVYPGGFTVKDTFYQQLGEKYPVLRGGNFVSGSDLSRAARRHGPLTDPDYRYTGFRLVRE